MTNKRKTLIQRALAGLSAAALGIGGVLALGTPANADVGPDQPGNPGKGSLTVHKYLGAPTTDPALPNDGTALDSEPDNEKPVDGVEFTIQQVGVQGNPDCEPVALTDPAGWDQVDTVVGSPTLPDGYCLEEVSDGTKVTSEGTATFDDLALGLYYVTEGEDTGNNKIVQKVAPFYVTVPYPSGEQTVGAGTVVDWTYNVHVYPKNATALPPSKTIDEDQHGLKVGDKVTWTITQKIPTLNEDDTFTQAQITDVLDSRLTLDSATIEVDGQELDAEDWSYGTPEYTWAFGESGLDKLNGAMGKNITVALKTTVVSVGDGKIDNAPWDPETETGYYSQFNNEPPIPGDDTPYTYWGELEITKKDQSDPTKTLEGAEFSVYEAPETGECPALDQIPGTTTPVATGKSNASGVVFWDQGESETKLGVLIKNSNTEITPVPKKKFCVHETKAPAGYLVLNAPKQVEITAGEQSVANGGEITVVNAQKNGPDLPLTGANGTLLMIVGGVALGSLAVGAHLVARRRLA